MGELTGLLETTWLVRAFPTETFPLSEPARFDQEEEPFFVIKLVGLGLWSRSFDSGVGQRHIGSSPCPKRAPKKAPTAPKKAPNSFWMPLDVFGRPWASNAYITGFFGYFLVGAGPTRTGKWCPEEDSNLHALQR